MARATARILGCGSSGGVPRLGNRWGECEPSEPRNHRLRCSLLLTRDGPEGATRVLIDTSPDMRAQLLEAGVGALDAVVYTHAHADHTNGLDDLRQIVFNTGARLPVWADPATQDALFARFGYAFSQPEGSLYPPILEMHTIDGPVTIEGAGGPLSFHPIRVRHGHGDALGFRVGAMAYMPDVSEMPGESWPLVEGLDVWILDALRRKPHLTHLHLDKALDWIAHAAPRRAVLTNMHFDMDYSAVAAETPDHVIPAHDELTLDFPL